MLATCYTGLANSKSKPLPGAKGGLKPATPLRSRAIQVLSAAGYGQSAFESQSLRADVYTHFFLDCMKRLSQKAKAASTIEIHACASQPTTMYVKKQRSEIQVPKVDSEPGANRDIFLVGGAKKRGKRGYFWGFGRKGIASYVLQPLVAQANQKEHTLSKQSTPPEIKVSVSEYIALKPGRYRVKVHDTKGKVIKTYVITIKPDGVATTGGVKPPESEVLKRNVRERKVPSSMIIAVVGGVILAGAVAIALLIVNEASEPVSVRIGGDVSKFWARSQSSLHIPSKRAQSSAPLWAVGGTAAALAAGGLTAGLVIHHTHAKKRATKPSTLKTLLETK
tara:strand:- start:851 stop:1858 length:1008 start_codon:yes stop_codon:yes gene_type:complete